MPQSKSERPILWIFAGPNRSGKSTLYKNTNIELFGGTTWIINPDLLSARISQIESLELQAANLEAVIRIERWLYASVYAHQTVGVESVLSTDKYRKLVVEAKSLGFEIAFVYILLKSVELNIERVRLRVLKGGHDVPEDKIRERYVKSLAQLPWFLEQADRAFLFDNSDELRKVGEKKDGKLEVDPDYPLAIASALKQVETGRID